MVRLVLPISDSATPACQCASGDITERPIYTTHLQKSGKIPWTEAWLSSNPWCHVSALAKLS